MTNIGIPDTAENHTTKFLGRQVRLNMALEAYMPSKWSIGNPASVCTIVMDFPASPSGSLIQAIVYLNAIKSPWLNTSVSDCLK